MTTLETQLQQLKASISDSFDLVYRNVTIKEHRCVLVFLSSLSDSALISDIVESIVITTNQGVALTLYPGSVEAQRNLHKAITALLSGQCLVLVDGYADYYCVDEGPGIWREN